MARLHFEIPDDLHDEIRRLAAERGQTIKGLVTVELRRVVEESKRPREGAPGAGD